MRLLIFSLLVVTAVAFRSLPSSIRKCNDHTRTRMAIDPHAVNHIIDSANQIHQAHQHLDFSSFLTAADEVVSPYSKVDKTGPIGFFADYIEQAIDLSKNTLNGMGVANAYGFSIILFTILSKKLELILRHLHIDYDVFFSFVFTQKSQSSHFAIDEDSARFHFKDAKAPTVTSQNQCKIRGRRNYEESTIISIIPSGKCESPCWLYSRASPDPHIYFTIQSINKLGCRG